jgi:hypothetical protein
MEHSFNYFQINLDSWSVENMIDLAFPFDCSYNYWRGSKLFTTMNYYWGVLLNSLGSRSGLVLLKPGIKKTCHELIRMAPWSFIMMKIKERLVKSFILDFIRHSIARTLKIRSSKVSFSTLNWIIYYSTFYNVLINLNLIFIKNFLIHNNLLSLYSFLKFYFWLAETF